MGLGGRLHSLIYQPDVKSKIWAKKYFIHPILMQNPSYENLTEDEKERLLDQIHDGYVRGDEQIRVAQTVYHYFF